MKKGEKFKKGENKVKIFLAYLYIYGLILHYNLLKLTRYFKKVKTLSSDLCLSNRSSLDMANMCHSYLNNKVSVRR